MSGEAPGAGTPSTPQDDTKNGGTPVAGKDGSGGTDEQKWAEALKWKQKAEDYNRLEQQVRERDAQLAQLQQMAYGGGRQATDPYAEALAQAAAAAEYDPIARIAVSAEQRSVLADAERWLSEELLSNDVPKAKREQVKALVRNANYGMSVKNALNAVTDPETKTLAEQLAETKAELERIKGSKPNGTSPSFAPPSTANADDGKVQETITPHEYAAILKAGGDRAYALKASVGSGKTKFVAG